MPRPPSTLSCQLCGGIVFDLVRQEPGLRVLECRKCKRQVMIQTEPRGCECGG